MPLVKEVALISIRCKNPPVNCAALSRLSNKLAQRVFKFAARHWFCGRCFEHRKCFPENSPCGNPQARGFVSINHC